MLDVLKLFAWVLFWTGPPFMFVWGAIFCLNAETSRLGLGMLLGGLLWETFVINWRIDDVYRKLKKAKE